MPICYHSTTTRFLSHRRDAESAEVVNGNVPPLRRLPITTDCWFDGELV